MKKLIQNLYKQLKSHGAAILAASAIVLAFWEGMENRNHNRLSVLPKLDTSESYDTHASKRTYSLAVYSSGLGPAVINSTYSFYDGKQVFPIQNRNMWQTIREELNSKKLLVEQSYNVSKGEFLPAGSSRKVLTVSVPLKSEAENNFQSAIDNIGVIICYCSVYGDNCSDFHIGKTPSSKFCE